MNQEQVKLVRKSWKVFLDIDPELVGDLFYSKLFTDSPSFKRIFPGDIRLHYSKLTDLITGMVISLDRQELLAEEISSIAQHLANCGIKPVHFKVLGDTLLWTLEHGMGKSWDKDLKAAWVVFCAMFSSLIIDASSPAQVP